MKNTAVPARRAILVSVESASNRALWAVEDSLEELRYLATTAGIDAVASLSQKLKKPNPNHYVGKGKLQEITQLRAEMDCDLVIFDDELSPTQQRNLQQHLGGDILDRTALILKIFAQRARTYEGRLQVELAQYEYMLPRLTRQWTHLSRQFGAIGVRGGPGETQLEIDRRQTKQRISDLKKQIEKVRTQRSLYREHRAAEGVSVAALVGYTNAGKSTLLRALTGAEVLVEDKLFATLDPTTRRITLPNAHELLLTDTVGFIQKLPTTLVAAFRATLEELQEADVLLHVVDITHPRGFEQACTVENILEELGLGDKPRVTVLNKADKLLLKDGGTLAEQLRQPEADSAAAMLKELVSHFPSGVAVSAREGWGLTEMLDTLEGVLADHYINITIDVPYNAGGMAALFRRRATVTSEEHTEKGTVLSGSVPARFVEAFKPYAVYPGS